MPRFNLGLNQKRLGANRFIPAATIYLGATKGRGSSTRMFNYCNKKENYTKCIDQFITITPSLGSSHKRFYTGIRLNAFSITERCRQIKGGLYINCDPP
jgi:hypothetical protein